ncbi:MAG TPA: hypothetical protein VLB46_16720 [Pyrinomonadaceae bacterium]|nr:hypothetical protein [Pyrinomonadaceae bacterium]
MKRKLIATSIAVFFATALIITGESLSHAQQNTQSFAVSKYGTLLDVFDANGKSRFGKLAGNGFEISYVSKGKLISVSSENAKGLLPGEVRTEGQSATVIATTSDHALEITTNFVLDEKSNQLIIQRKLRNISGGPLTVKAMREFVEPAFVDTAKAADRLTANLPTDDCQAADCPKGPPPCPIPCPIFTANQALLITRMNPATGRPNEIMVQWQDLRPLEQNNVTSSVLSIALAPGT